MGEKEAIRREARMARDSLAPGERWRSSGEISNRFFGLPVVESARIIMLFLSFGSEVDTWILLRRAVQASKVVVAPVIAPATKELVLYPISRREEAVTGWRGIPQPLPRGHPFRPADLDVVVVPGLTFDPAGWRIGYGGGYYDRFLPTATAACRIGVCFQQQLRERVPHQAHDVPMDLLITDRQVIVTKLGAAGERCGKTE